MEEVRSETLVLLTTRMIDDIFALGDTGMVVGVDDDYNNNVLVVDAVVAAAVAAAANDHYHSRPRRSLHCSQWMGVDYHLRARSSHR